MPGHFEKGAWREDPLQQGSIPFMRIEFYVQEDSTGQQMVTMLPQFRDVGDLGQPGTALFIETQRMTTAIGEAMAGRSVAEKVASRDALPAFLEAVR